MNRRNFFQGVAGLATLHMSGVSSAHTSISATVAVDDDQPSRPIPDDFTGLSYESAVLASPDYLSPANLSILGLILGDSTVDDFGWWSPRQIENLRWRRNSVVEVPAASAVTVKLSRRGMT